MDEGTWVRVADEAAFDASPLHTIEVEDESIIVCRIAGKYYAVENRCSHDDGRLSGGAVDGVVIECPRHGAHFDLTTGQALSMPAVTPIRTHPVKCEQGVVFVKVDV